MPGVTCVAKTLLTVEVSGNYNASYWEDQNRDTKFCNMFLIDGQEEKIMWTAALD